MRDAIQLVRRIDRDERALVGARTIEGDDAGDSARDDDRVVLAARGDDDILALPNCQCGRVEHLDVARGRLARSLRAGRRLHSLPGANTAFFNALEGLSAEGATAPDLLADVSSANRRCGGRSGRSRKECDETAGQDTEQFPTRHFSHAHRVGE